MTGNNRLVLVDGLRGIAALSVLVYHSENLLHVAGPFRRGYLFVDFFFLISGLVLTLAFERSMSAPGGNKRFLVARVKRFWPMNMVALVVGALLVGVYSPTDVTVTNLLLGAVLLPVLWGAGDIFPINSVQWSLMQELLANIAHTLSLKRMTDGQLRKLAIACGVALVIATAILGENTGGPTRSNWILGLPRCAFAYVAGILLARRMIRTPGEPISWRGSWAVMLLAPLALIFLLEVPPGANRIGPVRVIGDLVTSLMIFPAFLALVIRTRVPEGVAPWLSRLGAISFPLYAAHLPVLKLAAWHAGRNGPGPANQPYDAPYFTALAAAAGLGIGIAFLEQGTRQLKLARRDRTRKAEA